MKKSIILFLILILVTGVLTSCFKGKYYGGRTRITGGNIFNIISSNGIPADININATQHVEGAAFEIKTSNVIPVKLEAPDNPLTIQTTNPLGFELAPTTNEIAVQLKAPKDAVNFETRQPLTIKMEPDGTMQAHVTVDEIPLKLNNENLTATITLTLDPSFKGLLPSTIAIMSAPFQFGWDTNQSHSNYLVSPAQFVLPIQHSGRQATLGFLLLFVAGVIGRFMGWLFIPSPVKRFSRDFEGWISVIADTPGISSRGMAYLFLGLDFFAGGCAALLVPALMRMFPGSASIYTLDAASQLMTVFSFALLAGMVGVEFIRGALGLWRGLVAKVNPKGGEQNNLNDKPEDQSKTQ